MPHQKHYWVTCPECGHQMEVREKGAPLRAKFCDECDRFFYFTNEELVLTESVESESAAEYKRYKDQLRLIIENIPVFISVLGSNGEWIYANRALRQYIGMTLQEFRSAGIEKVLHPDDSESVLAARRRGLAGSDPFELDGRLLGSDGIYRWFLAGFHPLVEKGQVTKWYVNATEIESRKQEEDRVRQENVRLEERNRIARELHDTLLQTFISTLFRLGAAVESLPHDSEVKSKLDSILQFMAQGIDEGRNAIQGLRSSGSRPLDLIVALSSIHQEFSAQPDVDFRVRVVGQQQPLRSADHQEIYRIGREALRNAFCHSGADRIDLEIEYADTSLTIRVRDNGRGIDPEVVNAGRDGHWGLAGMRERAARIGGLLKISSTATRGTEILLSIPSDVAFRCAPADLEQESVLTPD